MADKFLQSDGIETGYWSKRKAQFNNEIARGLNIVGFKTKVNDKPAPKKTLKKNKPQSEPKDTKNVPPSQLKGKDFAERMKQAREAKAKEREQNEKDTSK